ncbi:hypothetical protein C7C46_02870 [Streptomyces tateyamensis]|uniref:Uncharacterized protein n=1 Tax=Streptomyces tateyamensis TaxID=565073 RepID=A0A2V4NME6_9ACTN|nr:hypothetical protein C7C46_02870 [Streptomyces tateyamensis]
MTWPFVDAEDCGPTRRAGVGRTAGRPADESMQIGYRPTLPALRRMRGFRGFRADPDEWGEPHGGQTQPTNRRQIGYSQTMPVL